MKITSRQLRQVIREVLLREATLQDTQVGPNASVSPDSDVGNSKIGIESGDPADNSSVSDSSTVINSSISGGSQVKSSSIDKSDIGNGSIITRSKIIDYDVYGSKITSATIRFTIGELAPGRGGGGGVGSAMHQIHDSEISDTIVKSSLVYSTKISGGSKITRSTIEDSKLNGTDTEGAYLKNVTGLGGSITSTGETTNVMNAEIQYVEIVNSQILGGTIKCTRGGGAYLERVYMAGTPSITGKPQIIGLQGPDGRVQKAQILDRAQISGSPKISGLVGGNAQVSGNAEVHGLAQVMGDCVVTGTARMINGRFTSGTYSSGTHEGGDGLVATVLGSLGL